MRSVRYIVAKFLEESEFDGLYNEDGECACVLDDLAPCGEMSEMCRLSYKNNCCMCAKRGECVKEKDGFDYLIRDVKCFVKRTNFDRITASPEALAEFVVPMCAKISECGDCGKQGSSETAVAAKIAVRNVLAWLNHEVEGED